MGLRTEKFIFKHGREIDSREFQKLHGAASAEDEEFGGK